MNVRFLSLSVLGAVILAAPALAASINPSTMPSDSARVSISEITPTTKCNTLENQLSQAIRNDWRNAKTADATSKRLEGESLCDSGKQQEGIAKLSAALHELGVQPKS